MIAFLLLFMTISIKELNYNVPEIEDKLVVMNFIHSYPDENNALSGVRIRKIILEGKSPDGFPVEKQSILYFYPGSKYSKIEVDRLVKQMNPDLYLEVYIDQYGNMITFYEYRDFLIDN